MKRGLVVYKAIIWILITLVIFMALGIEIIPKEWLKLLPTWLKVGISCIVIVLWLGDWAKSTNFGVQNRKYPK